MLERIKFIPIILYIVIFIFGGLNAFVPKFMWKKFESWKAIEEPSKTYFVVRRIGGIVVMFVILALVITPYLMSRSL